MAAQANLTLADAQGTPVNHTFVASGVSNGVATWFEKTASVIAGYFKITQSMRFPGKATDPVRHQMKLVLPTTVTETINGVSYNKVTRQSMVNIEVITAPDATAQEKKDLVKYASTCLGVSGVLGAQVIDNDPVT